MDSFTTPRRFHHFRESRRWLFSIVDQESCPTDRRRRSLFVPLLLTLPWCVIWIFRRPAGVSSGFPSPCSSATFLSPRGDISGCFPPSKTPFFVGPYGLGILVTCPQSSDVSSLAPPFLSTAFSDGLGLRLSSHIRLPRSALRRLFR